MNINASILKFVLIAGISLICVCTAYSCKTNPIINDDMGNIKNFRFTYSVGYSAYANYVYELKKEDNGKYKAMYKKAGVPNDEITVFTVDSATAQNLKNLLIENNILKWNGFKETDKNVLDGNDFYFSVTFEDGKNYNAGGYEAYPKGYSEGKKAIVEFYNEIMKEKRIKPVEPS